MSFAGAGQLSNGGLLKIFRKRKNWRKAYCSYAYVFCRCWSTVKWVWAGPPLLLWLSSWSRETSNISTFFISLTNLITFFPNFATASPVSGHLNKSVTIRRLSWSNRNLLEALTDLRRRRDVRPNDDFLAQVLLFSSSCHLITKNKIATFKDLQKID